jgi:hypothetical protein
MTTQTDPNAPIDYTLTKSAEILGEHIAQFDRDVARDCDPGVARRYAAKSLDAALAKAFLADEITFSEMLRTAAHFEGVLARRAE